MERPRSPQPNSPRILLRTRLQSSRIFPLMLAFIYWKIDPEIFRFGPLAIRWYGLFFALLFLIGYFIVAWQFRIEHRDVRSLESLLIYIVTGTIIGARLGHCLIYEPAYFLSHPLAILAVWQGGLASHGGAVGVLIATFLYSRRHPDQPWLWLLDRVAVPTALGGAFIRLGNFFNSEILGKPADVPWAIIFAREDLVPRHPAQLYESLACLCVFFALLFVYSRWRGQTPSGLLLGMFLVGVFVSRFVVEFYKEHQAAYEAGFTISVGQWLSIPFVLAGLALLYRALRSSNRSAGRS